MSDTPSSRPAEAAAALSTARPVTETAGADGSSQAPPPPADPPPAGSPTVPSTPWRRHSRLVAALVVLGAVLTTGVVSAAVVELDYYAMRPGSVRDTSEAITVEGTTVYDVDGAVSFTTVSVKPVSALEYLVAWLDSDSEIRHRDEILGGLDADENRNLNLQLMAGSQEFATYVALETVGYDVGLSMSGNLVHGVLEDYPAADVLEAGDVIVEIDGEVIDQPEVLFDVMDTKAPGDTVDLKVASFEAIDEHRSVQIELVADPDNGSRGIMGAQLGPYELEMEFPVDITFDTGKVGGPSAGLAFTLTLIDLLSEGDLSGDLQIAVTGTIGFDGSVGSVGGTAQKAAAARDAGMDLFLVPADGVDYENALRRAGDMEVVAVGSVAEALEVLEERGGDPLELTALDEAA